MMRFSCMKLSKSGATIAIATPCVCYSRHNDIEFIENELATWKNQYLF